jgi:hypothetical protein
VDLPAPSEDFVSNNRHFFKRIEEESREFCWLIDSNSHYVRTEGFAYLNSERSNNLWSDIYVEILSTIRRIDDSTLVALYESWKEKNDLRENAMIENIEKYCRENVFSRGVFSSPQDIGSPSSRIPESNQRPPQRKYNGILLTG